MGTAVCAVDIFRTSPLWLITTGEYGSIVKDDYQANLSCVGRDLARRVCLVCLVGAIEEVENGQEKDT